MSDGGQIYALIPKIAGELGAIDKAQRNTQQGYNFRGIDDIMNALHPLLVKYGVIVAAEDVCNVIAETYETKSKTVMRDVIQTVRFRAYAPDGSSIPITVLGQGSDSGDKSANKGTSAAMKYAYIQLFSIPTEDIEESDNETPEPRAASGTAKPSPKAQESRGGSDKASNTESQDNPLTKAWRRVYGAAGEAYGLEGKDLKQAIRELVAEQFNGREGRDLTEQEVKTLYNVIKATQAKQAE